MDTIRLSGLINESIVDGPGLRFVVFSQGCPHHCNGCHNPHTFDPLGGYESSVSDVINKIKKNPLLQGVTFSGGEPFLQAEPFTQIAKASHQLGLNVMSYTGYTFENLINSTSYDNQWKSLLNNIDILVDGPFLLDKKSLLLKFRGSSNQRIIDVKKSMKSGTIITIDN